MLKDNLFDQYCKVLKMLEDSEKKTIEKTTINKIRYYADVVKVYQESISSLINWKQFQGDVKYTSFDIEKSTYSTRLYEEVRTTYPRYLELIDDLNQPFKLFVMGTGNYGKSTVINSLLGTPDQHAKVGDTPVTWKIDVFEKKEHGSQAVIVFKDGRRKKNSKAETIRFLKEEEDKTVASIKAVRRKMRELYSPTKMSKVQKEELELKLNRDLLYSSEVLEVRWGISNSDLLNKFIVVDTPGLNQNNFSGEVRTSAREYYSKSDGVLWILDATTISAKGAHSQLEEINYSLSHLGGRRAAENMIGILNKIDLVSQTSEQRNQVIQEAKKIYGPLFNTIIPYSAFNAHEAIIEGQTNKLEKSGQKELISAIDEIFFVNGKMIQCDKKEESCRMYNDNLLKTVQDFQSQLENDYSRLLKSIDTVNDEMEKEITYLSNEFVRYIEKYEELFSNELTSGLEKVSQITDEVKKKKYISKKIFHHSKLVSGYEKVLNDSYTRVIQWSEDMVREHQFSQYESLQKFKNVHINLPSMKNMNLNTEIYVSMPSVGKSTAYTAAGAGMIFGPVGGLIGAGVGAYLSNKARNSTIDNFMKEAQRILDQIEHEFTDAIMLLTDHAINTIYGQIHESFVGLYNFKSHNINEDLAHAQEIIMKNEDFLAKIRQSDLNFGPTVLELVMEN